MTDLLKQISVSKEGINTFSARVINSVKEGFINPLEMKAALKALETAIDNIDRATRFEQLTEANKYPEKVFSVYGATIEKSQVGVSYDYSVCKDTVFERLEVDLITAKERLDDRKKFLQSLKEPMTIIDEVTGEVVTIHPPLKNSTDGLKFSIK